MLRYDAFKLWGLGSRAAAPYRKEPSHTSIRIRLHFLSHHLTTSLPPNHSQQEYYTYHVRRQNE